MASSAHAPGHRPDVGLALGAQADPALCPATIFTRKTASTPRSWRTWSISVSVSETVIPHSARSWSSIHEYATAPLFAIVMRESVRPTISSAPRERLS